MTHRRLSILTAAVLSMATFVPSGFLKVGHADQPTQKAPPRQALANDPFAPPKVDPSLPNVLLIGDSISIGYMLDARRALEGKANVFRPGTNCGPTTRGLEQLDSWLGDRKWDVVHFNFGLHDLKFMGPNGTNLADPKLPTNKRQVPLDEYVANLETIAKKLKATGATVIWRETTPVPEGASGRLPEDGPRYNEAAAKAWNRSVASKPIRSTTSPCRTLPPSEKPMCTTRKPAPNCSVNTSPKSSQRRWHNNTPQVAKASSRWINILEALADDFYRIALT